MLATPESMRTVAAMTEATLSGKVKDGQCDAAITFAVARMQEVTADYDDVTTLPLDNAKRIAYTNAESCFALSKLPTVLTSVQLASSGIVSVIERGTERREIIGSNKMKLEVAALYEREAFNFLRSYSEVKVMDSAGAQIGVRTKNRKLSIMGI